MDDREQRIRRRAYEIWEQAGRPAGREQEHWDQAERETEQAAGPVPGGLPTPDGLQPSDAARAKRAVSETTPDDARDRPQTPEGYGSGTRTTVSQANQTTAPSGRPAGGTEPDRA